MGIFQSKKIKLEILEKENGYQCIVDYDRHKNPNQFFIHFLTEFTDNKNCIFVIDSDNLYFRKNSDMEEKIAELKSYLEKQGVAYREIVTQKESENKILGIKMQSSVKVNSYKIAISVLPNQVEKVYEIIKGYNMFFYIPSDRIDVLELDKYFQDARGNYDELSEHFQYILYNDCLFHRTRISSKTDINALLNDIINKYENT